MIIPGTPSNRRVFGPCYREGVIRVFSTLDLGPKVSRRRPLTCINDLGTYSKELSFEVEKTRLLLSSVDSEEPMLVHREEQLLAQHRRSNLCFQKR